jgi:hypothetical protein
MSKERYPNLLFEISDFIDNSDLKKAIFITLEKYNKGSYYIK